MFQDRMGKKVGRCVFTPFQYNGGVEISLFSVKCLRNGQVNPKIPLSSLEEHALRLLAVELDISHKNCTSNRNCHDRNSRN